MLRNRERDRAQLTYKMLFSIPGNYMNMQQQQQGFNQQPFQQQQQQQQMTQMQQPMANQQGIFRMLHGLWSSCIIYSFVIILEQIFVYFRISLSVYRWSRNLKG